MHPNVRGVAGETCPECGMTLVAMPDRSGASYWLDVEAQPAAVPVGKPVRLRLTIRDRETNNPAASLEEIHERRFHLFVLSHDLTYFDHVHPEATAAGAFEVPVTLPKPGAYRLVADVLPAGAAPQTLQHTLITTGAPAGLGSIAPEPKGERLEAIEEGVRARLVPGTPRVGGDAHLVVEMSDAKTGAPVTDLEPYLGAWGHMLLADASLQDVAHSHPYLDETTPGGPTITFGTLFAREGWYRAWLQLQRGGRLLTFEFVLRVAPAV